MATPRKRVIDDTDPAIQYGLNGWFVANPTTLNVGNFGPIYNGTSHATSSDATLTFPFSGTSIRVYGTIMVATDANNVTDPAWSCLVDGIKIPSPDPTFKFPENNWVLCDQPQIAAGSHVLEVEVQSKGQTFYLDDLVYTPLPGDTFESTVLIYPNTDPSVSFGSDWSIIGGENGTQTSGAQVALNFHGTSASMYGFVPMELPHNSTGAAYSIDGGPQVSFTLKGLSSANSPTNYNVILFTTPTLSDGPHNLVVTHGGNSNHTPLVVQGFYVTNTTVLPSSSNSSPNSLPGSSQTPVVTTSKHSPAGAIAGGVIGALILLALIAVFVLWYRKRRRRATEATSADPYPMSMADGDVPPIALPADGNPYAYSPVSGQPYPVAPTDASRSSRARVSADDSRPSTSYPGSRRIAPLHHHPSDTMSSRMGTHTHQLSASSAAGSGLGSGSYAPSGSLAAVASHGSIHQAHALPTPQATPPPAPSKLAREMAAAAAYAPARDPAVAANPNTVVLRHEDSGVRLQAVPEPETVELPPGVQPPSTAVAPCYRLFSLPQSKPLKLSALVFNSAGRHPSPFWHARDESWVTHALCTHYHISPQDYCKVCGNEKSALPVDALRASPFHPIVESPTRQTRYLNPQMGRTKGRMTIACPEYGPISMPSVRILSFSPFLLSVGGRALTECLSSGPPGTSRLCSEPSHVSWARAWVLPAASPAVPLVYTGPPAQRTATLDFPFLALSHLATNRASFQVFNIAKYHFPLTSWPRLHVSCLCAEIRQSPLAASKVSCFNPYNVKISTSGEPAFSSSGLDRCFDPGRRISVTFGAYRASFLRPIRHLPSVLNISCARAWALPAAPPDVPLAYTGPHAERTTSLVFALHQEVVLSPRVWRVEPSEFILSFIADVPPLIPAPRVLSPLECDHVLFLPVSFNPCNPDSYRDTMVTSTPPPSLLPSDCVAPQNPAGTHGRRPVTLTYRRSPWLPLSARGPTLPPFTDIARQVHEVAFTRAHSVGQEFLLVADDVSLVSSSILHVAIDPYHLSLFPPRFRLGRLSLGLSGSRIRPPMNLICGRSAASRNFSRHSTRAGNVALPALGNSV
ncbi:hypothetical protein DFH09DRAFT_1072377 [Mycena vulgaris]|nr:hypothetical protein DFH09DRAFT_1072377 [Mycena vulgaris]